MNKTREFMFFPKDTILLTSKECVKITEKNHGLVKIEILEGHSFEILDPTKATEIDPITGERKPSVCDNCSA